MTNERRCITKSLFSKMKTRCLERTGDLQLRNSILNVGLDKTALNHNSKIEMQHTFSIDLHSDKITSQKSSGRCWLFAGLNIMRPGIIEKLKLKDFEFSQSYQMFFDKLEKANYFLENILETLDESTDSRIVSWLLHSPLNDGGQWDMFTSIVEKYGVVPKYAMPETFHSSASHRMNSILTVKLREYASVLRNMHKAGDGRNKLKTKKKAMLIEFYRLCTMFLGIPPDRFTFEYKNKEDEFHRDSDITPKEFYKKYVDINLEDYVSIINAPTEDKPFNRTYTVRFLGNVEGGNPVKYLNVDISTLKKLALKQLKNKKPVWFGCDVGKNMIRDKGILDMNSYDYDGALSTEFRLDKAGRLDYGESVMTHAMVFSGVNITDDGTPNRWKVENSWGKKTGNDGFFVMSDKWFEEYTYQIVVHKKHLTKKLLRALSLEPIVLNPWDPMGSLALL